MELNSFAIIYLCYCFVLLNKFAHSDHAGCDIKVDTSCFNINGLKSSFSNAENNCFAAQGNLGILDSDFKVESVAKYLTSKNISSVLFGITDRAQRGTLRWINGDILLDRGRIVQGKWTEKNVESCLLVNSDAQWIKSPCNVEQQYICEEIDGKTPIAPTRTWTSWVSLDSPTVNDQVLTVENIRKTFPFVCPAPDSVECQVVGTQVSSNETGDIFQMPCSKNGLICLNSDQNKNSQCQHYQLRFSCPPDINECETPGLSKCDPNAQCINTYGSYKCVCKSGFSGNGKTCNEINQCVAWGDPHYVTFDQAVHHVMGICSYRLTETCFRNATLSKSLKAFQITTANEHRGINMAVSYTKSVTLILGNLIVTLAEDGVLSIDGVVLSPPQIRKVDDVQVNVIYTTKGLKISTSFGVEVLFDGVSRVTVSVPSVYANQLCGMCGNMNKDQSDEWTLSDGTKASDRDLWGNSWMAKIQNDENCAKINVSLPHNLCDEKSDPIVTGKCSVLIDPNGPFKSCHALVDPQTIYPSCYFDLCSDPSNTLLLCSAFEMYAEKCAANDILLNWRSATGCTVKCGANQHYESTTSGCQASCDNPNAPDMCPYPDTYGCVCNDGFLRSGTVCKPKEQCGCYDANNNYKGVGEIWFTDFCSTKKTCTGTNTILSDPNVQCHTYGECFNKSDSGESECRCKPGFSGRPDNCTDIDECALGSYICSPDGDCINILAKYKCKCKPGFSGDGITCTDINECTQGISNCSAYATCYNNRGGFDCICQNGYEGTGYTCTKIPIVAENEDQKGCSFHKDASCHQLAECTDLANGSFSCYCTDGMSGDGLLGVNHTGCSYPPCPQNTFSNDGYCYVFLPDTVNQTKNEAVCSNQGGFLATFISDMNLNAITSQLEVFKQNSPLYIGYSAKRYKDFFIPSDLSQISNYNWASGHPKAGLACSVILPFTSADKYKFQSVNCTSNYGSICKFPSSKRKCSHGWREIGDKCVTLFQISTDITSAAIQCARFGGDLLQVQSAKESDFVFRRLLKLTQGKYWFGFNKNFLQRSATAQWADSADLTFTNFNSSTGNDQGMAPDIQCFQILSTGKWIGAKCNENASGFLCEKPQNMLDRCPSSSEYFNGKCYKPLVNSSRDDSEALCGNSGGYLVSVSTYGEQSFLEGYLYSRNLWNSYWIGLTENQTKASIYSWTDNSVYEFKNWGAKQPGLPAAGNCVIVDGSNGNKLPWAERDCNASYPGICEYVNARCTNDSMCHKNGQCHLDQCQCKTGYHGDGLRNCTNINECISKKSVCSTNEVCVDTEGSYLCNCIENYVRQGQGECQNKLYCKGDENCAKNGKCFQELCACNLGFAGDGKQSCVDVNECLTKSLNNCNESAICANTEGSYTCKCKQGYEGDGTKDCHPYPLNCHEYLLRHPASTSGVYTIDADGEGPLNPIDVTCEMRPNLGITKISHDNTVSKKIQNKEPFSEIRPLTYEIALPYIIAIINNSGFCSQDMEFHCMGYFSLIKTTKYVDVKGKEHKKWGTSSTENQCGCGEINACGNLNRPCFCDGDHYTGNGYDTGRIIDKSILPLTKIITGGYSSYSAEIKIGELKCGPKIFEIPKNCNDLKLNYNVEQNGVTWIDPDGDEPLLPIKVLCDVVTMKFGQTIIPHDLYPGNPTSDYSHSYPGPLNDPPSPINKPKTCFTYKADDSQIQRLIADSGGCFQEVKYGCQAGAELLNNKAYFQNSKGTNVNYFASGTDGKCNCGVFDACQGGSGRNCNCDGKNAGLDFGFIRNKKDLPVKCFIDNNKTPTPSNISVGPLICGPGPFGLESSCQKWLKRGYTANYTYLIDPDGGNVNNDPTNMNEFLVVCVMNPFPLMGITVIPPQQMGPDCANSTDKLCKLTALYPLTPEQIKPIISRSTYCTQQIKYDCRTMTLLKPYAGKRNPYAYWITLGGTVKDSSHSYFAGNGSKSATCQCGLDGTCDTCFCDVKSDKLKTDSGVLSNKDDLPVGAIWIGQDSSVTNLVSRLDLGPLTCYEIFPTCLAAVFYPSTTESWLFNNGEYTIDPDGPLGEDPITATCNGRDTIIKTEIPAILIDDGNPKNIGPKKQCIEIKYINSPSVKQLKKLTSIYATCKQYMKLTCKSTPLTNYVEWYDIDGKPRPGWAGNSDGKECACGEVDSCRGGKNFSCNCDLMSTELLYDHGLLVNKDILPVTKICVGLTEKSPPPGTKRQVEITVKEMICAIEFDEVYPDCQIMRENQYQDTYRRDDPQSEAWIIDPDGNGPGKPFTVYCDMKTDLAVGITVINLQPVPGLCSDSSLPKDKTSIALNYLAANRDNINSLISVSTFCEQLVTYDCQNAALFDGKQFGAFDSSGNYINYWIGPNEKNSCSNVTCNCAVQDGKMRSDSGKFVDKSRLPLSKVTLPSVTGVRKLCVQELRCYNLLRTCEEYNKQERLSINKGTRNNIWAIDPDQGGKEDYFGVLCKTVDTTIVTETLQTSNPQATNSTDSTKSTTISYTSGTVKQIQTLTKISIFCSQKLSYYCTKSGAMRRNGPILRNAYGDPVTSWVGADFYNVKDSCACNVMGICPYNETCRCDALSDQKQFEGGIFTDRNMLPITQITYSSGQNIQASIYPLDCGSQPFGLPKDCIEARTLGYVDDNEILILPPGALKPYLVSCRMNSGPNKKMQVTIVPVKENSQSNTFSYPSASLTDIQALVKYSGYCLQAMKMRCQGIMFSSIFSWMDGSGKQRKNFGTTGTSSFCPCGIQDSCARYIGESRESMLQRNCSCDDPNSKTNLADATLITTKSLLPISSVTISLPSGASSSSNLIKVGPLLCAKSKIDFDECQENFHDCDIHADCTNTDDGFQCTCRKGWQGLGGNEMFVNGRSCVDDNECAFALTCPSVATCTNTPGSYKCTCNTGFRQTGPTSCEDIDECTTNSSTCDSNARCVNTYGSYICACNPGYRGTGYPDDCEAVATCGCWGDPHCLSFDGNWLHYQGRCKYTLVQDGCNNGIPVQSIKPTFEVIMKNWDQNQNSNQMVSWAKEITVKLKDYVIMMKLGFILTVNGQKTSIPFSPTKPDGTTVGFNVTFFGSDLRLTSTSGLEVRWDGASRVDVSIPGRLKERVCGLCGNYNSNPKDDWIIGPRCKPTGNTTEFLNLFGDSWQNDDPKDADCSSPDCEPRPNDTPCSADLQTQSSLECKKLITIFSECQDVMKQFNKNLDDYIESCIYDRCHTTGDLTSAMCKTAEALAIVCLERYNVTVKYRNENFCNLKCKQNMTYSTCGSACQPTCYKSPQICMALCVEGCFCNQGYVMENGNCIKPVDCGCLMKDGTYYTNGENRTNRNCTEICGCNPKTGQLDCVNITCSNDAVCDFKDDDYGCHCKNGFMGDGIKCKDIDECTETPTVCGTNAHCSNTPGSYKCLCDEGFEGNGITCSNINECSPKSPCLNVTEECFDKIPGYVCKCAEGFMKNTTSGKCEDKNECADTGNQCDRVSTFCNNTFGSYRCECKYGFRPSPVNSFVCTDVNECILVHECDKNYAKCTNTPGSYYCTCNYGYDGDGRNCTDIDECSSGTVCPRSDATCVNLNGSYECRCPDGRLGCAGEDPCNSMECRLPHEVCHLGLCLCTDGYERNATGNCTDIDECSTSKNNCAEKKGNCTNLEGTFDCACLYGYRMNPKTKLCENIVECEEKTDRCGQNAECVDTDGGYFCQCKKGFTGHCEECHDIDECSLSLNKCDLDRGRCENSVGSFRCICNVGYSGDGTVCKDNDECTLGTHNCTKSNQFCFNTDGAFKCLCLMGYTMDLNGSCADNNECLYADNGCHENAECINTQGSFQCVCRKGYAGSGKKCVPLDGFVQCGKTLCPINGECRNGTCFCKSGYQSSDDQCININECLNQTTCDINANCLDTMGSFVCTCNDGYVGDGIDCFVKKPDIDICRMESFCIDGNCYDGACHCPEGFTFRSNRCYDDRCQNACPFNAICSVNSGSVECICSSGTSLSPDKSECLDIDECAEDIHDCQENSLCFNSYGSYACKCSAGYVDVFQDGKVCKYLTPSECKEKCPYGQYCNDGNCACYPGLVSSTENQLLTCTKPTLSCQEKTCPMNSVCEERPFGYLCHCNEGYEGVGQRSCDDINECARNSQNCVANEVCKNLPGSFRCSCKEGFTKNETTNLCESQVKCLCGSHGICTDDKKCICKPGYQVSHEGVCEDVDECKSQSPCHLLAKCTNTPGSFKCQCPDNFYGDPTMKCIEDKCQTKTLICPSGQECSNSLFGSVCVKKKCNSTDILIGDDCVPASKVCQSLTCARNAVCRIENGRPDCFCDSGYFGDGDGCENIDECSTGSVNCPENSRCQDREGSYSCACSIGFERSVNSSVSDPCTDIDECQMAKSCATNAKCTNSIGSFSCDCNPGYIGDAKYSCQIDSKCERMNKCHKFATCAVNIKTALYECLCNSGYSGDGIESCIGDNLCYENGVSKCHPNAQCFVANTTYRCICPSGFLGDGYNFCNDVDECADPTKFNCSQLEKCLNNPGGYSCVCGDGATSENGICIDIDECSGTGSSKCSPYSICKNTQGSYTCRCTDGFFGDGVQCIDIDECLLGLANCSQNALCRNTPGSFACECQAGTIGNGTTCIDEDECAKSKESAGAPQCDENAVCKNTYPGYACTCKPGYHGTGWYCARENPCNTPKACTVNETCAPSDDFKKANCDCKPNYKRLDKSTCVAVQECENGTDNCDRDSSICVQLERGYKCQCKPGFNAVGNGCEDKNECDPKSPDFAAQHCFASGGGCLNTKGSFRCTCSQKQASDEKSGCRPVDFCALKLDKCDRRLETCISGQDSSYVCKCIEGYEKINGTCVDIDECKLGIDSCKDNATCLNVVGSYTCICPSNLKLDESKLACTDRNECFENPMICGDHAKCVNLEGSFSCVCVTGYKWNGKSCEDIDECATKSHPCHEYAKCSNIPGSCTCKCKTGYTGDGIYKCSELDSCPTSSGVKCPQGSYCNMVGNVISCNCTSGYEDQKSTECKGEVCYSTCTDIDECVTNKSACHHLAKCTNNAGGYACQCPSFMLGDGKVTCEDQDECALGTHTCNLNTSSCENLNNTAENTKAFSCNCFAGYIKVPGTENCVNNNECLNPAENDCDQNSKCIDTEGSYKCQCDSGFRSMPNRKCADIDECVEKTDQCARNSVCQNKNGGFHCVCSPGFQRGSNQSEPCSDIDECQNPTTCLKVPDSVCVNNPGGFECVCPISMSLQGGSCLDTDECLDSNICGSNGICQNTKGGYNCTCKKGLRQLPDGDCEKINECLEGVDQCKEFNGANSTCFDLDQDYSCSCPQGFVNNPSRPAQCEDLDECATNTHNCPAANSKCVNTYGSFRCSCNSGFVKNSLDKCIDIDECDTTNNKTDICNNNKCTNTQGGYTCECSAGYTNENNHCQDIDECTVDPVSTFAAKCDPLYEECVNTPGHFKCVCRKGFDFNKTASSCQDINECELSASCKNGKCYNYPGTFQCICNNGFNLTNGKCIDIDECIENPTICGLVVAGYCINLKGSYQCKCNTGYENSGGISKNPCQVINECAKLNVSCPSNSQCVDRPKGYECICKDGYEEDEIGICRNINECQIGNTCHYLANCTDTEGSYTCTCRYGYKGDGKVSCTDICDKDSCPKTQMCKVVNTDEYECGCQCQGDKCIENGQVCDTNGTTYLSVKQMFETSCKKQLEVEIEYYHECKKTCAEVLCPGLEVCSMENGRPACTCTECTEEDRLPHMVCTTNGIQFQDLCQMKTWVCITKTQVTISYEGPCQAAIDCQLSSWTEWSTCSKPCGIGSFSRTRRIVKPARFNGNCDTNLKEVQDCFNGPCAGDKCEKMICARGSFCENGKCICPDCSNQQVPDPICGKVGDQQYGTFRTFCTMIHNACMLNATYTYLHKGQCGDHVPSQPDVCSLVTNFEIVTLPNNCTSTEPVRTNLCAGGCGKNPNYCCRPLTSRVLRVKFQCKDNSFVYKEVKSVASCGCKLEVASTASP